MSEATLPIQPQEISKVMGLQGIETVRIAREAQARKKLAIAEVTPAVQNGLLSREQVAYCMAWKDVINPQSKVDYKAMYTAMEHEAATIALFDSPKNFQ